ncbi:MAG: hypothetical protein ACP5LI_03355 [Hydrogenobaculum sp.]
MEYPKTKFEELARRIKSMAISPEIDLAICFPGIEEAECEERGIPLHFGFLLGR